MPITLRHFFSGLVLSVAVVGAGCASSPATSPSPSAPSTPSAQSNDQDQLEPFDSEGGLYTVDPCALMTTAEVESIIGSPLAKTFRLYSMGDPKGLVCRYKTAEASGFDRELQVRVWETGAITKSGFDNVKEWFDSSRSMSSKGDIAGLGDEAFWSFDSVRILKGNVVLETQVMGMEGKYSPLEDATPGDKKASQDAAAIAVKGLK